MASSPPSSSSSQPPPAPPPPPSSSLPSSSASPGATSAQKRDARAILASSSHSTVNYTDKGRGLLDARPDTRFVHAGVHRDEWTTDPLNRSVINPPVYRASTISFPDVQTLIGAMNADWPFCGLTYGLHGNPTTWAMEEAFAAIEEADNACSTASGSAAISVAVLAFVSAGDHVIVTDAVYNQTKVLFTRLLKRMGVHTTFIAPTATPDDVRPLMRDNTRVLFLESPATCSFEVMDVSSLTALARQHGVRVIVDNTWGPSLSKPLALGADVSINAATKYLSGSSDVMVGLAAARDNETFRRLKKTVAELGCPASADDAYLALRGMRTLHLRLARHSATGLTVARWLEKRVEVKQVMHPGLESHAQHELFKKHFSAPSGLFGFQLVEGYSRDALMRMVDGMRWFAIGFSWGGNASLIMPVLINGLRTVAKWPFGNGYGWALRLYVGLEDVDDLIEDLLHGLERLGPPTPGLVHPH